MGLLGIEVNWAEMDFCAVCSMNAVIVLRLVAAVLLAALIAGSF